MGDILVLIFNLTRGRTNVNYLNVGLNLRKTGYEGIHSIKQKILTIALEKNVKFHLTSNAYSVQKSICHVQKLQERNDKKLI